MMLPFGRTAACAIYAIYDGRQNFHLEFSMLDPSRLPQMETRTAALLLGAEGWKPPNPYAVRTREARLTMI
jgi:hypothetical protein